MYSSDVEYTGCFGAIVKLIAEIMKLALFIASFYLLWKVYNIEGFIDFILYFMASFVLADRLKKLVKLLVIVFLYSIVAE